MQRPPMIEKVLAEDKITYRDTSELLTVVTEFCGIIIQASDTVLAVTASPLSATAVALARHVANCPPGAPIPVVAGSVLQATAWVELSRLDERVAGLWPGRVTLVCPARGVDGKRMSRNLGSVDGTVGIRVSSCRAETYIAAEAGVPLTSTALRDAAYRPVRTWDEATSLVWERLATYPHPAAPWALVRRVNWQPAELTAVMRVSQKHGPQFIRAGEMSHEAVRNLHTPAPLEYRGYT